MNKECKRKVLSIVVTLILMIPFVLYQYYYLGNTLKHRLDNLKVYEWIASQPAMLTSEGYITIFASPRFGVLGNLQDLVTITIFILLILFVNLFVNFIIGKILCLYFKKKDSREFEERKV